MSNSNLYRIAGWSAILSVLLTFGLFGAMATSGRGAAFVAISIVASVLGAIVFYALYLFHRAQSAMLSLAMLICGLIGLVLENIGAGPESPPTMIAIALYGVAFLILGYLGYSHTQMPHWVAILAYIVGLVSLIGTGANAALMPNIATPFLGIQILAWIAWSVGIAILFLSRKLATS